MKKSQKKLFRALSFISGTLLVVQSLLPGFFAIQKLNADDEITPAPQQEQVQETTPAPEPPKESPTTPTEAPKPTDTPAPTPPPVGGPEATPTIQTPTPTPVSPDGSQGGPTIIESALTPTLTETPTPTSEASATPSPKDEQPKTEEQTNVSETGPPKEESSSPASETTPSITPSPTPTPAEIEKACSTEVTNQTSTFDWDIDSGREMAQTHDKVTLGTKYVYPYDSGVSVTFTCLPKDEALRTPLKIERVKISDLKLPSDVNPDGEYAYDITTGMADGTFSYSVTLPKSADKTVDVSYIEKTADEIKNQTDPLKNEDVRDVGKTVSQEGSIVKVEGIDHFTIWFSVDTYANSGVSIPKDTFALGDTVYAKGTSSSKKTIRLQFQNPSDASVKDCTSVYAKETTCSYTPTVATPGTWHVVLQSWDDEHDHWDSEKTADFTVSPPPCTAKTYTLEGQRYGDGYVTGNLCNGPSCWAEGDSIPARLTVAGLTIGSSYSVKVQHDYLKSGHVGYENFNTPTSPNATGVSFTALPNSDCGGGVTCKNYTLSFTASSATVQLNWIALLGDDAADWSGASLQYRLTEGACGECVGDKTIPVNPKHKVFTGTLQVLKNVDLTGDGDFGDAGETGATDWEWQATSGLTTVSGHTGDPATTVTAGDYTLSETMKSNFHFKDLTCTGGTLNEYTKTVTVGKNATVICTFENLINTVSISGYKWNDQNGDGNPWVWDFWPFWGHWEPKLPNWTIFIDKNGDGVLNGSEVSTTTDVNGDYHFTVIPGTYSICEVLQSGWSNTYPGVCQTVTISKSDCHDKTDINFGNKQTPLGTLTVLKYLSPSDDLGKFNLLIDGVVKAGNVGNNGTTGAVTVSAGAHTVSETAGTGTDLTKYTAVIGGDCDASGNVTVNSGQNKTCTITNTVKTGTITIVKNADPATTTAFTYTYGSNPYPIGDFTLHPTTGTDSTTFTAIPAGTYIWTEQTVTGWDLTGITCTETKTVNSSGNKTTGAVTVNLEAGETVTCTYTNKQRGSISGSKWNDTDSNGIWDTTESKVTWTRIPGGVTIYLDLDNDGVQDPNEPVTTTDANGDYVFTNAPLGRYGICERDDLLTGWTRTYPAGGPCKGIFVNPGEHLTDVNFGNHYTQPKLELSKINNAAGDLHPGDSVTYTITVKALDNPVYNVKMTDLLPSGFVYRPGSATQDGNPANFDHEYASPGTWSLGNLAKDQTVTLTLIADISSTQYPGTYKDLALSYGCAVGEESCPTESTDQVVADAVDPGKVVDTFAGTKVTVVKDDEPSADAKIIKDETKEEKKETTGEVLGASTTLPGTGSDTKWIAMIVLFVISGVGMIVAGKKMTRRYHA